MSASAMAASASPLTIVERDATLPSRTRFSSASYVAQSLWTSGHQVGGGLEVGQGRERLKVDIDQRGSLSGDLRCRRRDRRDQFALPAHDVPSKEGPVLQEGAVSDIWHVGGGEDRVHARQRSRGGRVEPADAACGTPAIRKAPWSIPVSGQIGRIAAASVTLSRPS